MKTKIIMNRDENDEDDACNDNNNKDCHFILLKGKLVDQFN